MWSVGMVSQSQTIGIGHHVTSFGGHGHSTIPFYSISLFHSTIPFHRSIPPNKDACITACLNFVLFVAIIELQQRVSVTARGR